MGLNRHTETGDHNTDVTAWRRKTLDLLYYIAAVCATIEIGFLFSYFDSKPEYSVNLIPYIAAYVSVLTLTFVKVIPHSIRANGLAVITFGFGVLDLLTTGLTGDGRIFLMAAPVIALLVSGTRSCEILTILSLIAFFFAGFAPYLDFIPIEFIPQEETIGEFTWLSSGIIFGTVLIGLVTVVWQFARINTRTSQQNNRLASEGKALREMATKLQLREVEMQALLNAIGDKVLVIDQQGRIVHSADGSFQTGYDHSRRTPKKYFAHPSSTTGSRCIIANSGCSAFRSVSRD